MSKTVKVIRNLSRNREDQRLREPEIIVPRENLSISRSHMPQIDSQKRNDFLSSLEKEGISHQYVRMAPIHLKATQGEFDLDKVRSIIKNRPNVQPSIISKDNFVLDGHHRWLADYNIDKYEPSPVLKINMPILDLLAYARRFKGVEFKKN